MKQLTIVLCSAVLFFVCEGKDTEAEKLKTEIAALKADIESALEIHNKARKDVRVSALRWSRKLAGDAQDYANLLAKKGAGLVHAKIKSQGENLYLGSPVKNPATTASKSWYNEISGYKYSKILPANFATEKPVGHYTQMVWRSTRQIGIGMAVSEDGRVYVVARYFPAGNFIGQYPY